MKTYKEGYPIIGKKGAPLWIVVWLHNEEAELHYVGPFHTAVQAVLWETKFLRDNPWNYTTKVCELVPAG